jgi:hypothetical protein
MATEQDQILRDILRTLEKNAGKDIFERQQKPQKGIETQAAKDAKARQKARDDAEDARIAKRQAEYDKASALGKKRIEAQESLRKSVIGSYKGFQDLTSKVSLLKTSTSVLSGTFETTTETFLYKMGQLGGVFGGLALGVSYVTTTFKVFKTLNDVGENFNGSLLNLSISAAEARLPLGLFAEAILKNSETVKIMGGPQVFGALNLKLRDSVREFGMFGMSLQDLTMGLGDYLEGSRIQGTLNDRDQAEAFKGLLLETTGLSQATGKSRKAILADVEAFRKDTQVAGIIAGTPIGIRNEVQKALEKTAAAFSSLPGDAGKIYNDALKEALPWNNALMAQSVRDMNAFAPELTSAFQNTVEAVKEGKDGLTEENFLRMKEAAQNVKNDQNRMNMLTQLAGQGDAAAQKTLATVNSLTQQSVQQFKDNKNAAENMKTLTMMVSNFQDALSRIIGWIQVGFLKGIKPLFDGFEKFAGEGGGLARMEGNFTAFGEKLGAFVAKMFDERHIEQYKIILENVGYWSGVIFEWASKLAVVFGKLVDGVSFLHDMIQKLAGGSKDAADIITVGLIGGLIFFRKWIAGFVKSMFGFGGPKKDVSIQAAVVNVHGGSGGGSGGGGVAEKGGKGSRAKNIGKGVLGALVGVGLGVATDMLFNNSASAEPAEPTEPSGPGDKGEGGGEPTVTKAEVKSDRSEANAELGESIGSTAGSIAAAALASPVALAAAAVPLIGPLLSAGVEYGAYQAGGWLGGKAGNWIGGMFGGGAANPATPSTPGTPGSIPGAKEAGVPGATGTKKAYPGQGADEDPAVKEAKAREDKMLELNIRQAKSLEDIAKYTKAINSDNDY